MVPLQPFPTRVNLIGQSPTHPAPETVSVDQDPEQTADEAGMPLQPQLLLELPITTDLAQTASETEIGNRSAMATETETGRHWSASVRGTDIDTRPTRHPRLPSMVSTIASLLLGVLHLPRQAWSGTVNLTQIGPGIEIPNDQPSATRAYEPPVRAGAAVVCGNGENLWRQALLVNQRLMMLAPIHRSD